MHPGVKGKSGSLGTDHNQLSLRSDISQLLYISTSNCGTYIHSLEYSLVQAYAPYTTNVSVQTLYIFPMYTTCIICYMIRTQPVFL
ncbi:hypothetical protein GDO81_007915 [Engystomops pustulosus]|uniref:Uncharacterized protein n=1 Tax=Engystomops pustulosus TaxID=76066 RepID=A0AAV7CAP2_ENGPU|nr:hypothetical protein GDO81_007915 [Engystomops pustulosus]